MVADALTCEPAAPFAPRVGQDASPWTQEVKDQGVRQSPPDPEAKVADPFVGDVPEADGRAEVPRIVVPRTTANDAVTAISTGPR